MNLSPDRSASRRAPSEMAALKILYITGSYPPMRCGVGDYTAHLAEKLAASAGVEVAVLTSDQATAATIPEAVTLMPLIRRWNIWSLGKVLRAVRQWRPDIVHLQYPTAGYGRVFLPNLLPLMLKLFKVVVVQTWHEFPIYSFLLNAIPPDTVIAVEPDFAAALPVRYRGFLWRKRLVYIPIASNIPAVSLTAAERGSVRDGLGCLDKRLVVYFGFAHETKGVDAIFNIADPDRDRLVLICDLDSADPYQRGLLSVIATEPWQGKVLVTGHMDPLQVAKTLAAADVALLPFEQGVSEKNGSFLAARAQGTFIVTTHRQRRGMDCAEGVYYAAPGDTAGMRELLQSTAAESRGASADPGISWEAIAQTHLRLYRELLEKVGELANNRT